MRFGIDIGAASRPYLSQWAWSRNPAPNEIEAARNIIETRLDDKNITDREVTTDNEKGYVIVRFRGNPTKRILSLRLPSQSWETWPI